MPRRPYVRHSAATVAYLRQHYGRQTMPQLAAELGIALPKLQELARRHRIKKQWPKP